MSETDNDQTVMAAASTQVKLCPYDEEEPAIWFRLIEAQFAAAGIKSSTPCQVVMSSIKYNYVTDVYTNEQIRIVKAIRPQLSASVKKIAQRHRDYHAE
jgi:hypothetical protein